MYSFCSLTLKQFVLENYDFLKNSSVQKVQQPSRREIILNLRSNGISKKLYININPKYPHICFIDEKSYKKRALQIPKSPPMFCMQLRKYIEGTRIKEINVPEYERILEFRFEVYDEIGQLVNLCLAVEVMGKHSNIILYDSRTKNILGSAHNISPEKSSVREVYGGIPYIYPPKQQKTDILRTSLGAFCEVIRNADDLKKKISSHYYYLSEALIEKLLECNFTSEELFFELQKITSLKDMDFLCNFWGEGNNLNAALDKYFSDIMFNDIFNSRIESLSNILKTEIKKLSKNLKNPPKSDKAKMYKEKGDAVFQYIYLIKAGDKTFKSPEGLEIELDETLSPSLNAQRYYKLYQKAKGAYEYARKIYDESLEKKEYYDGILFSLSNAKTYEELDEIEEELEDCSLIKKELKNSPSQKINVEKIVFMGYEIYLGKNNKQNDYLVSKLASGEDIWLHTYNCPSSHVLIKTKDDAPKEVLEFAAKLVKENSPAKNSGKTPIIYTKRKNLKKPPGGVLGYVIYKNEKEIII